jgi:hypothetical protein
MNHAGCHQLVSATMRPSSVVAPGCQIGYVTLGGVIELCFDLRTK